VNIPFINRKRYIVLKCYTPYKHYLDAAPIIGGYEKGITPIRYKNRDSFILPKQDFSGCWSRVVTRKKSATVPLHTAMRIESDGSNIQHSFASECKWTRVDYVHDSDPVYPKVNDVCVTKIVLPWFLQSNSDVPFVIANHLLNSTYMNIISGIQRYDISHGVRIFNIIPAIKLQYEVPALTSILSLYPLSEKPFHIESYADEKKCEELSAKDAHRLHYDHSYLKTQK